MPRSALLLPFCAALLLTACSTPSAPPLPDAVANTARAASPSEANAKLPPYRAEQPLVILISLDGFRYDYLDRGITPNLSALATDGVRTDHGMRPSFPSVTFPNHYTLVTGVRPDRHGIVANNMDDARIQPDHHFATANFPAVSDRRWWDGAEPIWVTARKAGVRSATMYWPGSEADAHGVRPDLWTHFDSAVRPDHRVDHVLDWLDLAKRPGFVTLYFEHTDTEGHEHGTTSPELTEAIRLVDAAVGRLVEGLKARGLYDRADIIVLADHGMIDTPVERHVFVEDWAPPGAAKLVEYGAIAAFEPQTPEGEAALLVPHPHAVCYRKADLPPRLHFGSNPRIPPIYCLGEAGYYLTTREADARRRRDGRPPVVGDHGYDPTTTPQMAALFVAHGPDFRRGVVLPSFDNVDVQPLLLTLLRIAVPPGGDGSVTPLAPALRDLGPGAPPPR